jgi:pimeloyl-ACP methyl ester carboxylesterase
MKMFLRIIKWVMYILIGCSLLFLISLQVYKINLRSTTKIETAIGISSLEEITLGGVKQWIFIRGTDEKNPFMIFLHGGPGAPMGGISSSRKFDAELIKHFAMVHWDQRGAGKSYNEGIPINSMTYDRLVEDCNELIDYVRNKFSIQKVFIVGHSSGSIIGIKTAHRYPDKIHAYVGVAQIINEYEKQRISYDFVAEEAEKSSDVKIQNAIKALGPPPYDTPEKDMEIARYIVQYAGFIRENPIRRLGVVMLSFLTSPEYSLSEGFNALVNKGLYFSMNAMWGEITNINLAKEIQSIKVPIYFFEGKYDMIAPMVLVENFYNNLEAEKGKKLFVFENSAHVLMLEEKEKYEELLVNVVLKESRNK